MSLRNVSKTTTTQPIDETTYLSKEHVGGQSTFRGIGVLDSQHGSLYERCTLLGSLLALTLGLDFFRHVVTAKVFIYSKDCNIRPFSPHWSCLCVPEIERST
jgi:hypothetical protein